MSKQILLLVGAMFLCAGAAQADTPETQTDGPEIQTDGKALELSRKEAPAPVVSGVEAQAEARPVAKKPENHPDGKPVYLDGGHFGGSEN